MILIEIDELLDAIILQHGIYGMTVEEIIQYIRNSETLEEDRYGDCNSCFDDEPCDGCEEFEWENNQLKEEIIKLKENK